MVSQNTPYIYDEFDDDDVQDDLPEADDPDAMPTETVIEDGVAMSYRSYQRRRKLPGSDEFR